MYVLGVLVLCAFAVQVRPEKCTTPNNEQGDCVSLNSCTLLAEVKDDVSIEEFLKKSVCGSSLFSPKVCCGSLSNFTRPNISTGTSNEEKPNVPKKSLLASRTYCGFQHSDDYFRPDNDISIRITEFPWLAQIKHKSIESSKEEFKCAGSLINNRYVLTSSFCLTNRFVTPIGVRLGEYYTTNETDCVKELEFDEECTGGVEDFGIEKIIIHPHHNDSYEYSIGLIRLNRTVQYSDYIRPICLPSPSTNLAKSGDLLLTSGWGQTLTAKAAVLKKKIWNKLITNEECEKRFESIIKVNENLMCTTVLSNSTDIDCHGDAGSPAITKNNRTQWQQEGLIVAGGPCGKTEIPTAFARIDKYVEWIEENLEL